MQDIRLYINDTLVDLPEDVGSQLRLSKGGADVSNIDSRTADQSYSLLLPLTRHNETIFRNADIQTTAKFFTASPYRARLEVGGQVLLAGGWRLTGVKGGYQGLIYADEVDVFGLIAEKQLRDITTFAPVAFRGGHGFEDLLYQNNRDTDICFPLVAYGNFFAPAYIEGVDEPPSVYIQAHLEIDDYTPSVYYINIIRHIFESIGWRAGGEPMEDDFFRKLCLPYVGDEYLWNWGELLRLRCRPVSNTLTFPNQKLEEGNLRFFPLPYAASYNPAGRWRQGAYHVRREGGYDIALKVGVDTLVWSDSYGWEDLWVEVRRVPAGAPFLEGEVLLSQQVASNGTFAPVSCSLSTRTPAYLQETDRIVPVLRLRTTDRAPGTFQTNVVLEAFSITPAEDEIGPQVIDIAANLPEMNQRDFVKSFLALGNLRFDVDTRRKAVTFYYHDRYQLSADFAVDFTGLADPEESEFVPATNARRFLFRYTEDGGDMVAQMQKGFADLTHDTRNANAGGDQPLQLPFAATAMREYREGGNAFALPCMASQEQLEAPLNTVSWNYSYTPRLLRYEGASLGGDAGTLPLAFTGGRSRFGVGSFDGLRWVDLYDRYYRDYLTSIVKGHLLKNSFALSPDLYRQLSPARPVLFHGILYRLNKIQGYRAAEERALADVELLRITTESVGGGKPKEAEVLQGKEFYGAEFYMPEWY